MLLNFSYVYVCLKRYDMNQVPAMARSDTRQHGAEVTSIVLIYNK